MCVTSHFGKNIHIKLCEQNKYYCKVSNKYPIPHACSCAKKKQTQVWSTLTNESTKKYWCFHPTAFWLINYNLFFCFFFTIHITWAIRFWVGPFADMCGHSLNQGCKFYYLLLFFSFLWQNIWFHKSTHHFMTLFIDTSMYTSIVYPFICMLTLAEISCVLFLLLNP